MPSAAPATVPCWRTRSGGVRPGGRAGSGDGRCSPALLARYESGSMGALPSEAGLWSSAVARYSGSPDATGARVFADDVYETMRTGAARTTAAGQAVRLTGDPTLRPDTAAIG